MMKLKRTSNTSARREGGAAVVEAALILPLFLLLLFGVIEAGMLFYTSNSVKTAARDSAREISAAATDPTADLQGLRIAQRSLTAVDVEYIIVFKAEAITDHVPAVCVSAAAAGDSGEKDVCNIYTIAQIKTADVPNFGADTKKHCKKSLPACPFYDSSWPPLLRKDSISAVASAPGVSRNPDLVGVYIVSKYHGVTGVLPSKKLTGESVFAIEPQRTADV
jgi:TadE-like protein